jgi:hypothetical protein
MAHAIKEIRSALTDAVMTDVVMPLMNSKLGFRTDKDPARPSWDKNTRSMKTPEPYGMNVVRECVIESALRGVPIVGNCMNIIAQNSYVTKEGFWFLIGKRIPGLTDFKITVGVPRMIKPAGDARNASDEEAKGSIVVCSATWKMNGVADRCEREIPIRVNAMMGADAIMGKAERKILAASYAQITGTALGDADAADVDHIEQANMRNATPAAKRSNPFADQHPVNQPETNPAPDGDEPMQSPVEVSEETERGQLMVEIREILADNDFTLAKFAPMCRNVGLLAAGVQLPAAPIESLRTIHANRATILKGEYQTGKDES